LEACETPPVPGADVFEPSDVEFFLANRLESRRSEDFRSTVRTDYDRLHAGEMRWCDPAIIGPSGHSYGCCNQACGIPGPLGISLEEIPMPAAPAVHVAPME
jgi:pilus assembly protein CpaC